MAHPNDVPKRGPVPGDMRQLKFKHRADAWIFRSVGKTNFLLNVLQAWLKLARLPGALAWHPLLKPKNNHWYNMPLNVELRDPLPGEQPVGKAGPTGVNHVDTGTKSVTIPIDHSYEMENIPLTSDAVRKLIDEAEYIHISDRCLCRHGRNCQNHRHDIGCMFLGAAGCDVTPEFSHPATKEQAYHHLEEALEDGLMPMSGRFRVDNYAFILPDHHKLIGVCFCCDCCCYMSFYRNTPSEGLDQFYDKMPGVRLFVDPNRCIGCGECAAHCYLNAITIVNGKSQTSDVCRACGRCVDRCKQGARHLVGSDPAYALKTANQVLARADIQCSPDDEPKVAVRDTR